MNQKILILISCLAISSCATQKTALSPFIAIYSTNWIGHNPPQYLILRTTLLDTHLNTYEVYDPLLPESIFGEWHVSNDTLYLFPEFECYLQDSTIRIQTQPDTSVATIPQKYLIEKDCLIDLTDYSGILPNHFDTLNNRIIFKRVKCGL